MIVIVTLQAASFGIRNHSKALRVTGHHITPQTTTK
ncbi:hypothetical protein DND62_30515 [Pseudomonas syringae pv. pisi]|nr:hypothetical protein DND62_30515 [Pseudomonas syringae pv. pisi]